MESIEAKAWLQDQVSREATRIKDGGARAIPLPVKNCGVMVEHGEPSSGHISHTKSNRKKRIKVVNRLEIGSGMDFSSIKQIMVSEPQDYPFSPGYQYVHVLAFTDSSNNSIALLLPYIYAPYLKMASVSPEDGGDKTRTPEEEAVTAEKSDKSAFENSLKEWLLINEKHGHTRHSIDKFHAIG